ncbi:hypothetical protein RNZ50_25340 [Paracoccaceae bacterium Fryx2]|nr:hypothetical protein [Paracoccaceae bacterium Fryx2]
MAAACLRSLPLWAVCGGGFCFLTQRLKCWPGLGNPYVTETQAAGGTTLRTAGWGLGLRAGDFFQLGLDATTRLYQLTADVTPVGSEAELAFVPSLRSCCSGWHADRPECPVRSSSANGAGADGHWPGGSASVYDLSPRGALNCEEV